MTMYPLLFEQKLLEKVWGGHSIHEWKYGSSSNLSIGESWEVFSGNVIKNGEHAGKTLQQMIEEYPQSMIGKSAAEEFPLLVKILDANEWLSVQVHPDDHLARILEGEERGKTECWYILRAEEGACIQYDLKENHSVQEYADSISEHRPKDCLEFLPVKSGDIIYVPAGTVHAIGPGIMLYELQQTSDTTYRLYDWDRPGLDGKPRELHIEKGLQCTKPGAGCFPYPAHDPIILPDGTKIQPLIREQYFLLDEVTLGIEEFLLEMKGKATLVTNISKHPLLIRHGATSTEIPAASSTFLPACLEAVGLNAVNKGDVIQLLIATEHAM